MWIQHNLSQPKAEQERQKSHRAIYMTGGKRAERQVMYSLTYSAPKGLDNSLLGKYYRLVGRLLRSCWSPPAGEENDHWIKATDL